MQCRRVRGGHRNRVGVIDVASERRQGSPEDIARCNGPSLVVLGAAVVLSVAVAAAGWDLGLTGTHRPAPKLPCLHPLAAAALQMAPMVALSGHLGLAGLYPQRPECCTCTLWQPPRRQWRLPGHLGLVGMHPPARTMSFTKFLAATGLQVALMAALLGHLGLQLRVSWVGGGGGQ